MNRRLARTSVALIVAAPMVLVLAGLMGPGFITPMYEPSARDEAWAWAIRLLAAGLYLIGLAWILSIIDGDV